MIIFLPLVVLAIPIACIAWTVTHEELFREFHDACVQRSERGKSIWSRKFFYLFTCEYCFSHYVALLIVWMTHYHLLFDGWRGYFLAFFSLVFVANVYMSLFGKIRIDIKKEKEVIKEIDKNL